MSKPQKTVIAAMLLVLSLLLFACEAGKYKVEFFVDGKVYLAVRTDGELAYPSNPSKTGYGFTGWQDSNGQPFTATEVTDNTKLYASFAPNTYTVVYDKNATNVTGEMTPEVFTYDQSRALKLCTFQRSFYTFAGWATNVDGGAFYEDGELVMNLTAVNGGTITLYAMWAVVP